MTNEERGEAIAGRIASLKNYRSAWEDLWDEVTEFIHPRRTWTTINQDEATAFGDNIYDGTPGQAAQMLADGMMAYLVSPAIKWFSLRTEDPNREMLPGVRRWLQEVEEHFYGIFRRSNFYHSMAEYFLDAVTIGTATMYSEEDPEREIIVFSTRHPYEIYIAENQFGVVDTIFREFTMTARQLLQKFPNLPEEAKRDAMTSPDLKKIVQHCVYPGSDDWLDMQIPEDMAFHSIYVLPVQERKTGATILRTAAYRGNPFHVWRFRKNSNETYGRSPSTDALYDAKMINQMGRTGMKVAQRAAEPAYNVPEDMRGRVRVGPLGMNYYEDPARVVMPIPQSLQYPITIEEKRRLQDIIENRYHTDLFLLLSRAEKTMTAREVVEKQGEKAAILGTIIGRLDSECLDPLFDRVFDIEWNAGRLPPLPPALANVPGTQLRIEYNGPLAQAQRRLFESQGTLQALDAGLPLAQFDPSVLDEVKLGVAFRKIVRSMGIDEEALRDEPEVALIRKRRAQAQAAALQAQQMEQMGKAAGGLNEPVQPGSPLEQIQEQARQATRR